MFGHTQKNCFIVKFMRTFQMGLLYVSVSHMSSTELAGNNTLPKNLFIPQFIGIQYIHALDSTGVLRNECPAHEPLGDEVLP